MSSGTSTSSYDAAPVKQDATDALQPWQLFTLAGLIGATIVVFVSRGHSPAGIVLLSLTIFAAAVVAIATWRTFAPLAGAQPSSSTQMLGGRTRAALEREKTLVLRSIKELEFDRAMRKVSEKDFAEMSARLRLRAAGLIRQLDAGTTTYRDQIKEEINRRIGKGDVRGSGPLGPPFDASAAVALKCPHCGTDHEADARFCKRCGASLEPSE
jgi:hypothetical protein